METWGYVILIAAAVVIGAVAQFLVSSQLGYGSVVSAIAAGVAGYVFSEFELFGAGKWGAEYFGITIFPALIAALVAAVLAEVAVYYTERSSAA